MANTYCLTCNHNHANTIKLAFCVECGDSTSLVEYQNLDTPTTPLDLVLALYIQTLVDLDLAKQVLDEHTHPKLD